MRSIRTLWYMLTQAPRRGEWIDFIAHALTFEYEEDGRKTTIMVDNRTTTITELEDGTAVISINPSSIPEITDWNGLADWCKEYV